MKILIDSYNECFQNSSGGVRIKLIYHIQYLSNKYDIKLFDKWKDRLSDYDLLHVFKPGIQNVGEIALAKDCGIPVVVSSVAALEKKKAITYKRFVSKFAHVKTHYGYMKQVYDLSDVIITETSYERDFICSAYDIPAEKVQVIPNGICIDYKEDYSGLFSKKYGINQKFALQVGRFDRNKNQLSTIEAVKNTGMELVLIGGPDYSDSEYFNQCKAAAGNNVHFIGWIDHEDPLLVSAYQDCQCFILPSHKEIFGNSLIEAAACGANIVATDVLPLSDWGLIDYCYPVKANSIDDIRNKLLLAYEKPKDSLAVKLVRNKFSWDAIAESLSSIYDDLGQAYDK